MRSFRHETSKRTFLNKIYLFDLYYNGAFFRNFLFFSVLFVVVYFFSMLLSSLPELFKKASYNDFVTTKNILTYYFYLIPKFINDTIAFAYLFCTSYTLGVFYRNREVLALVSSGVQTFRLSLVSLIFAFLLGIALSIANCWIFPYFLSKANTYNMKLNLSSNERYINNIQVRDDKGILYFGQYFLEGENTLQNFLLLKDIIRCPNERAMVSKDQPPHGLFDHSSVAEIQKELLKEQGGIPECVPFEWYIRGTKMTLNPKTHNWEIFNFVRGVFDPSIHGFKNVEMQNFAVLREVQIKPEAFKGRNKDIDTLYLSQAFEQLRELKAHIEPTYTFSIDLVDKKFLKPFYSFFMALFAATLGQFFSRRHVFVSSLIFAFSIAFGFLVLVNVGYSLAKSRTVPVPVGISMGYVLGLIVFIYLYRRRRT